MFDALKERYIADSSFYHKAFKVAWPITLSSLISSSMEIVDAVMVSSIGMTTAISNAGQFPMIYYLMLYGLVAAIAIYASQFYGANDTNSLKKTFGLCLLFSLSAAMLWLLVTALFGKQILTFFLNDEQVVYYGLQYLKINMFAMPLAALNRSFGTMYRSTGEQKFSMITSLVAGSLNIVLNYLLIFGKLGFPNLGIVGAAVATVISQSIELIIQIIFCYKTKQAFLGTFKELFHINKGLVKAVGSKTLPLVINETVFGIGSSMFIKAYGYLGPDAMTAYYIGNQIYNVFLFAVYGLGGSVSVILATTLGSKKIDQAIKEKDYLMFIAFILTIILVTLIYTLAPLLVSIFKQSDLMIVKDAISIVKVLAFKTSMRLFNYVCFAVLRSGGRTKTVQLLDSGIVWLVGIPIAFLSVLVLKIQSITLVLLICQIEQLIRLIFISIEVKTNRWAHNLTEESN